MAGVSSVACVVTDQSQAGLKVAAAATRSSVGPTTKPHRPTDCCRGVDATHFGYRPVRRRQRNAAEVQREARARQPARAPLAVRVRVPVTTISEDRVRQTVEVAPDLVPPPGPGPRQDDRRSFLRVSRGRDPAEARRRVVHAARLVLDSAVNLEPALGLEVALS